MFDFELLNCKQRHLSPLLSVRNPLPFPLFSLFPLYYNDVSRPTGAVAKTRLTVHITCARQ